MSEAADPAGYPLDGRQQYFLLDDTYPLRVRGKDMEPYNLTRFFSEAVPVSKEEFDQAVQAQEAQR